MTHLGKSSRNANRRLSIDYLGWGKQPDDLLRAAFTSGLVVLDANVLLALYEVGSAARDEVLTVLQNLSIRMWVPHQTALEFSRNRQRVVVDRVSRFGGVRRIAQSATKEAVELLESAVAEVQLLRERNRTTRSWDLSSVCLDRDSLDNRLSGVMDAALEEISAVEAEHDLRPEHMQASDVVFREIDRLLAGRIGSPLRSADLRSAIDEAINFRYPNKIPPGYHDTDKLTDVAAAGDYLLWWETLARARNDSTIDSVLLVTSDSKPDWWEVDKKGKVVGPRPELVQEMGDESNKSLVLASLADLLDGAGRYLLADVSQETVQQVRDVQAEVSAASSSRVEVRASGFVNLPDLSPMELEGLIGLLLQAMGYSVNSARTSGGSRSRFHSARRR